MNLNQKNTKMKSGKILLGILSGAAAGAAMGILFAPKKGTDTRQKITDKSNEVTNRTRTKFNEMVGSVSSKYDHLKSRASRKSKKMETEMEGMDGEEKIIY